jgi:cytidylate kinase
MIVTIDGPAGAGKSTVAKAVAQSLAIRFLDTGAMYRAFAWKALQNHVDYANEAAMVALIQNSKLEMTDTQVILDGQDVTGLIRNDPVSQAASISSALPGVRKELVRLQQEIGRQTSLVTEGRDQGSVAFPHAEHKFYLFADPAERARRRHKELLAKGQTVAFESVYEDMKKRDERDMNRAASPLRPPEGSIQLDTTHLTLDQVIGTILQHIQRRSG